jgi:hypothetical protein
LPENFPKDLTEALPAPSWWKLRVGLALEEALCAQGVFPAGLWWWWGGEVTRSLGCGGGRNNRKLGAISSEGLLAFGCAVAVKAAAVPNKTFSQAGVGSPGRMPA